MSWTADKSGNVEHECDRCGAAPSEANPFGGWAVVLVPKENAKHFCNDCLEPLKVLLDEVMSGS